MTETVTINQTSGLNYNDLADENLISNIVAAILNLAYAGKLSRFFGSPRFPVVNPISSVLQIILAGPERRAKYAGTVALDYKFRNSGA